MVFRIILAEPTQWIVWESESAVLVNHPDDGKGEEDHALSRVQLSDSGGYESPQHVVHEAFKPMAIEGTIGEGDIELVVDRVDVFVIGLARVSHPMAEIRVGIQNKAVDCMSGDSHKKIRI